MRVIYVFGSNLAGRHGKGSALIAAQKYGAIRGVGVGIQGDSYGIPTKDHLLRPLDLSQIQIYVDQFKRYAGEHPELSFWVVPIGCMNAGYAPSQIAPLFGDVPDNVELPKEFLDVLYGDWK